MLIAKFGNTRPIKSSHEDQIEMSHVVKIKQLKRLHFLFLFFFFL